MSATELEFIRDWVTYMLAGTGVAAIGWFARGWVDKGATHKPDDETYDAKAHEGRYP